VSSEVTPSVTRAGAASGFIQKETHCGEKKLKKQRNRTVFNIDDANNIDNSESSYRHNNN
jgi:hypothetical protein